MKVQNSINGQNNYKKSVILEQKLGNEVKTEPNFKGIDSLLSSAGFVMNGIEKGGFLTSFLIQDTLGMTAPRVGAGFLRDKEVTGKYNKQEGFEVLLREGLTGPLMMAVAPTSLLIAAAFGRTTSVNTRLIRRLGENLKDLLLKSDIDNTIIKNKDKITEEFFNLNIKQILENTLGKENFSDQTVKHIVDKLKNIDNVPANLKKGKHRSNTISEITEYINNIKFSSSDDLNLLNKVRFGKENNVKEFSTSDTLDALLKFTDEAITSNKNFEKLSAEGAENIKDAAVTKRILTTIATVASTLGIMSVIPKIYARNDIAPGARTAMELAEAKKTANSNNQKTNSVNTDEQVAFKGRGDKGLLSKIGKKLNKISKEKFASQLEYNGHNFTPTLMTGLSLGGLLAPRGLRAYNRAQVNEDGKKDLTELYEILIRDVSSSISVVFLVPLLTRACVNAYEENSGFVLMHKDRTRTGMQRFIDLINPFSSAQIFTNSEFDALYNNVNTQEKMVNFCSFIEKNGGDLDKILSKSENLKTLISEGKITLPDVSGLDKNARNSKIRAYFENLGKDGKISKENINEMIEKIMKGSTEIKDGKIRQILKKLNLAKSTKTITKNPILSFAKGLNSVPGLVATFLISPFVLGWLIPRATYANTRRIHENNVKEKEAKINA